jgi:hypothetical protein
VPVQVCTSLTLQMLLVIVVVTMNTSVRIRKKCGMLTQVACAVVLKGLRCAVDNSRTLCLIGDAACAVVRKIAQKEQLAWSHKPGGAVATDTGQFSRWDCVSFGQRM